MASEARKLRALLFIPCTLDLNGSDIDCIVSELVNSSETFRPNGFFLPATAFTGVTGAGVFGVSPCETVDLY